MTDERIKEMGLDTKFYFVRYMDGEFFVDSGWIVKILRMPNFPLEYVMRSDFFGNTVKFSHEIFETAEEARTARDEIQEGVKNGAITLREALHFGRAFGQ